MRKQSRGDEKARLLVTDVFGQIHGRKSGEICTIVRRLHTGRVNWDSQEHKDSQECGEPISSHSGKTSPDLIGRGGVLDEFAYGLRIETGAPGRLTIFSGARGIGKTVMLGAAAASRNDLAIRVAAEFVVRSVGETKLLILS